MFSLVFLMHFLFGVHHAGALSVLASSDIVKMVSETPGITPTQYSGSVLLAPFIGHNLVEPSPVVYAVLRVVAAVFPTLKLGPPIEDHDFKLKSEVEKYTSCPLNYRVCRRSDSSHACGRS